MLTPTIDSAYFPKKFGGIHDRYFSKSEILLITGKICIKKDLFHFDMMYPVRSSSISINDGSMSRFILCNFSSHASDLD